MGIRRYLRFADWVLLLVVTVGCYWLNERAEQQFDMVTKYNSLWVFQVSFFVPLATTVYFTWKYRLFDRSKLIGCMPTLFFLVSIVWLYDALPRFVLLASVPATPSALQDVEVAYVHKHYAKTTYTGSTIGIRYGGEVLRFKSSRTNFFLLQNTKRIRAEIGQAAPGFYYIRHLQRRPGEQEQARSDYWRFFWQSGEGTFLVGCLSLALILWLLELVLSWRAKRRLK